MADQPKPPEKGTEKKGFLANLGLFQKIALLLILLAICYLLFTTFFGGITSFYQLIAFLVAFFILLGLGIVLLKAIEIYFKPSYYSPKEDYFTRVVNMGIDYKPDNLQNIYFQGDKEKRAVYGGKIIGCIGLPYLIGEPELDKDGKWMYMESKLLDMKIPKFKNISYGKDGDTLFIYEKGSLINKRRHYLRCAREFHGDLNGDVVIYDINPTPYGKFWEYPFKQIQRDVGRIMIQSQLEVVIATHDHQGDLISKATDMGLYSNTQFRAMEKQQTEITRDGP